jgi:hypothetical protein
VITAATWRSEWRRQMVALGVVPGNDYARNIPSKLLLTLDFGLSKNLGVIKSLKLKFDVRKVVGT